MRLAGAATVVATLLAAAVIGSRPAAAGEISALIGRGGGPPLTEGGREPSNWDTCYGGMLTITLFNVVHGEIEGIYQGSHYADTNLLTLSGKAYFGPSIGRLVPYVGLGAGVYNEGLPTNDDHGTTGLVFVGAKLKFPMGLVVRGEYQWVNMPAATPVKLDHRYFLALGLGF
jgi:hypothetical protein